MNLLVSCAFTYPKDWFHPESKQKEDLISLDEASISKKDKKKKGEKTKCPYCKRGNHLESECMKKTIDQMDKILVQHNIALPEGAKKTDFGSKTYDLSRPRPYDRRRGCD